MKLVRSKVAQQCREIAGLASIVEANAELICRRANSDIDDGRRGTDYSASRRGGSDSTSVEAAALSRRPDPVATMTRQFHTALSDARRAVARARELGDALTHLERREEALEAAGAGHCSNCNRYCSGTRTEKGEDRIKSGRCEPCWKYEKRTGRERPRALWGGDSIVDTCPGELIRNGRQYRCEFEVGHDGNHVGQGEAWLNERAEVA